MGIANDYTDSASWETWQSDPSTRTAVQPWDRYVAFSGTVGTSAVDALNIYAGPYYELDRGGTAGTTANWELATSGSPGINRITNPSIEHTTISEFTADGSAISRTTSNPHLGSAELTVNPANSAAKEGFYVTTGLLSGGTSRTQDAYIVASGMVRGASASGDAVMQITDSSGTVLATGAAVSLTTSYQRVSVTYKLTTDPTAYRVKFCSNTQHNIDMYWDALMYDFRTDSNDKIDYIDGSLAGGNGYEWEGTVNLSRSRHTSPIGVIRGISIRNTHASNVLYVAFDCEAEASTAAIKLSGNDTTEHNWFNSTHPLDFRKKVSLIASGSSTSYEGVIWGSAYPVG
tara:strand:- start:1020 stop:2054 length:1035 start_codon:yes stop_codon:yes gene_type:complete